MSAHQQFWPRGLPATLHAPLTTLPQNLAVSAARYPERAAVIFYDGVLTYAELSRQVLAMAGYLQQRCGVARGDRVLLVSQNCPQFVVAYHAIMQIGAIAVPVNAMCIANELDYLASDSGAHVAFAASELLECALPCLASGRLRQVIVHRYAEYVGPETDLELPEWICAAEAEVPAKVGITLWREALAANLAAEPVATDYDDPCLLPYTSGTTGKPKGCIHTHRTVNAAVHGSVLWRKLHAETVFLGVAPMFHLLGMQNCMNLPVYLGATVVMLPRWNRDVAAVLIERYRVSAWSAPPAMLVNFFSNPALEGRDLSSLALLWGGGAAMPEAVAGMLRERFGISYNESYGLTETAAFLHANPVEHGKRQCLGIPTFGVDSRIVDPETLEELPRGEVGELITSAEQLMKGYWQNERANAEAFIKLDGKRFFRTGDLAYIDEDGYFFMRDRLKRIISVSGYKVWPAEVESALYHHEAILEACVISVADAQQGEMVKAVVVLRPEYRGHVSEADIIAWARQHMAVYKAPRVVAFVDELVKSSTGKILWRELQEAERLHAVAS
ncbi:long-chain-fatty-acid--CoA ligase [Stutzerimonas tarimensis]|uniref:Long-chain-fatty-acid--CoA ligase n=1 Tax=Stutzerimonas tarimensis TaxID=1507735 RepID=A0ABV7TA22_9GAMM